MSKEKGKKKAVGKPTAKFFKNYLAYSTALLSLIT